ncbi:MAG: type I-G CRISPR-associated RAMP protein Csb1/Cas7g [Candidatus Entotheonellia bacterium]
MNQNNLPPLTLDVLRAAVSGTAAAFRCVTKYQPAGGPGEKVFPPTYAGGVYAKEDRRINGEVIPCVLLDSVQSQANRMEEALSQAYEAEALRFPLMVVDFSKRQDGSDQDDPEIARIGRISALEAPHRIADALFRDSVLMNGTVARKFRESVEGRAYENANTRNATAIYELCPTALIFGTWDSTGSRGGLGNKFARILVSEVIGVNAIVGVRTSSRIDPLGIPRQIQVYDDGQGGWTLQDTGTLYGRNRETRGRPSAINHGNIPPDLNESGGVTVDYALQTTVLSLPGLRRLWFPGESGRPTNERNIAARTVLAALALAAVVYHREVGCDLRSRCLLVPTESSAAVELVQSGSDWKPLALTATQAAEVFAEAVKVARGTGLRWREEEIVLWPISELVNMVREGHRVLAQAEGEEP